jgi:hypothetical protein
MWKASGSLLVFRELQTASEDMIPIGIPNDVRADASALMGLYGRPDPVSGRVRVPTTAKVQGLATPKTRIPTTEKDQGLAMPKTRIPTAGKDQGLATPTAGKEGLATPRVRAVPTIKGQLTRRRIIIGVRT